MGTAGALLFSLVVMGVCTTRWRGLKSVGSLPGMVPGAFDPAGNVENYAGQDEPSELSSETTSVNDFQSRPGPPRSKRPACSVLSK